MTEVTKAALHPRRTTVVQPTSPGAMENATATAELISGGAWSSY
ncbi:MAG: hypothetical protein QXP01_03980 [Candidatus Hadarchaeum sp.]|nr:hypothetical protein [candidate division KSB1 bacterium]